MNTACSSCGADLPEEARFCPRCGTPTEALVSAERKIVTVLFADLADSTALLAGLDPERFREVQAAFYREASECLAALRGRAEKFIGDSVMAVFGLPRSHDDDGLRAVRAAVEIRDRTGRLGAEHGLPEPLRVRVGVDSGPVVVGAGFSDQFLVSGTAVNLAARLQAAAEPGEILTGETTRQLTRNSVTFGPSRSVVAKGFADPVEVWPVAELSVRSSRRTIPLVGRRREMALLTEAFARARDTSRLHLVTVLGEPGIGKSRLAEEFLASVGDDVRVMRGRASRFEEDALFAPVAEMVRREIGASRSAEAEEIRVLVRKRVTEVCRPDEVEEIAAHLEIALGVGDEGPSDRPYRVAVVRAGLVSFLEGLAAAGPIVIAFEDLELARAEFLELVEQLAARGRRLPALVLCLARDEVFETRPAWAGGLPDAMSFRLEALPAPESVELVRAAGAAIDEETARAIAQHAGGNPFFIVETTGMLLHERSEGPAPGRSPPLPATVQAVVAARIDHLDDGARDLVRKASVFARSTFRATELAIVAEPSEETLARLQEEELLERDRDQPDVWRFRHDVVRDVAYDSLPKRERLRLHLALADRLVADGRFPGALAFHLERGARASLDLDPSDRTLAERAAGALLAAGDLARRRMESRSAIDLYERALAFAGAESAWGNREAHVMCGIGEACYWLGEFDRSREVLTRALRVAPGDGWTRCVAHRFLGDIALNIDGDVDKADAHFAEALPAARALPEDAAFAVARTLLVAGWVPYTRNDLGTARSMFEEALTTARGNPEGDRWAEARALTFVANVTMASEPLDEYLPLLEEAVALGRKMNDPFTTAVAEQHYGNAIATGGRPADAIPHLEASVARFRELGLRWETASAAGDLGEVVGFAGRWSDSLELLREALTICRELGDRQLIGWVAADVALALRALGRGEEARAVLDETGAVVDLDADPAALRIHALMAVDAGDARAARAAIDRYLELQSVGNRQNGLARATWFGSRLLGADAVGGPEAVRRARERLETAGWMLFIDDPTLPEKPLV